MNTAQDVTDITNQHMYGLISYAKTDLEKVKGLLIKIKVIKGFSAKLKVLKDCNKNRRFLKTLKVPLGGGGAVRYLYHLIYSAVIQSAQSYLL